MQKAGYAGVLIGRSPVIEMERSGIEMTAWLVEPLRICVAPAYMQIPANLDV